MKTRILCFVVLMLTSLFSISQGEATIELVKDLNQGGSSNPNSLFVFDDLLYFTANMDLWVSDGTEEGTLNPFSELMYASNFYEFQNKMYFAASVNFLINLWVTDGTEEGTSIVKEINPNGSSNPMMFFEFGDRLYFVATDELHGYELWYTDGAEEGTHLLKDISEGSSSSSPREFTIFQNKLFFTANDGVSGIQIWMTDGTEEGTGKFSNFSEPFSPTALKVFNDFIYFRSSNGRELWRTDGTPEGTELVREFDWSIGTQASIELVEFDNKLFFSAAIDGGTAVELWSTDGTTEGTQLVKSMGNSSSGSRPREFYVFNNKLIFSASGEGSGPELWASEGTYETTYLLKDISQSPYGSSPRSFIEYNGKLYFKAQIDHNWHLFESDGTEEGTIKLYPEFATTESPLNSTGTWQVYQGSLFFGAHFDEKGVELYKLTTPGAAVSIPTIKAEENYLLYPNPTAEKITIQGFKGKLKLYDMQGKIIREYLLKDEVSVLDLNEIQPGIYILQDNENIFSKKIMKY